MNRIYLFEIVLQTADSILVDRDEIEDRLNQALSQAGIGTVTGGGSGGSQSNIDVDVTDFDKRLAVIREVLQELQVAPSTVILHNRSDEQKGVREPVTYRVYG